ncbi:sodium:solute symporter [Streptomyces sp. NPDC058385]|uniref:sodium:solute symporter family protein n=1 Tax=Streptomyces sp. NPDC058385 TaxID=3346473 RepID=UPI0036593A55
MVIAYLVIQFGVGISVYFLRRVRGSTDYVVSRGGFGMFVLGGTLAATQLSSATALGDVAWTSAYGIGYLFLLVPFLWAGYWISARWVSRKMLAFGKRANGMTIPDIFAARYDSQRLVRSISAIILIGAFLFDFGVQFNAAGLVLNALYGLQYHWAVVIAVAVFLGYTYIGGLRSIAYNDVIQICLFVVAYGAGAFFAVRSAGGLKSISASLHKQDPSLLHLTGSHGLGFWALLGLGLSFTLIFVCYPIDTMKFYSAKNQKHLLYGIGIAFVLQAVIVLAVIVIGLSGRAMHPNWSVDEFDGLVPGLALHSFPPVLGGLIMAIVIGAVMAVSSSILLTLGATLANDLYIPLSGRALSDRAQLRAVRVGVVVVALGGAALSFISLGPIATVINNVLQVMAAAFAVTMLAGLTSRRPNRMGAVLAMIGGAVGVSVWLMLGKPWGLAPAFLGLVLSLVGMYIGTRFGKPVDSRVLDEFFPPKDAPESATAPVTS